MKGPSRPTNWISNPFCPLSSSCSKTRWVFPYIIPLLPLVTARFGATPITIGIFQATYLMMQCLGAPVFGHFSDRFGQIPILLISRLGTFAGFVLLGFASTLWLLFLSRIIEGLYGANMFTAHAAIADSTTEKTRTQGFGLIRVWSRKAC